MALRLVKPLYSRRPAPVRVRDILNVLATTFFTTPLRLHVRMCQHVSAEIVKLDVISELTFLASRSHFISCKRPTAPDGWGF